MDLIESKGEKIKTRIEELKEKNNPILLDKNVTLEIIIGLLYFKKRVLATSFA